MTREEMIMKRVKEHYDETVSLGFNVFAVILQGSQNYGLDEYSDEYMSDIDTKAIIIPSFKDLISGKAPYSHTHVRANNEHIDIKDIRSMFEMFKKQNISYLELLASEFYIVNEKYRDFFEELRSYKDRISRMDEKAFLNALCGSAHQKFMAMTHVAPHSEEKIAKFGYDPKELHHLLRYYEIEKLFVSGSSLDHCLLLNSGFRNYLMLVKKGTAYSLDEALHLAEIVDSNLKTLKDSYIEKAKPQDKEMYNILDELCYRVLYTATRRELLNEKND